MSENTLENGEQEESGESYFVSMTDMMVGMLFLFIIMLMAFALSYRDTTSRLSENRETRQQILEELKNSLRNHGIKVDIDAERGVMRLPEKILFGSGRADLSPEGLNSLRRLAEALTQVLPCYTHMSVEGRKQCKTDERATVEAVVIEGHTDNVPLARGAPFQDNWVLSTVRAITTYKSLIQVAPELDDLRNVEGQRILGVSGYADRRPVAGKEFRTPTPDPENRRIDLRFIMATPHVVELVRQ